MVDSKQVPEVRFEKFGNKWDNQKLGHIGEPYTGLTGKSKGDFGHGKGRYVTYMGVFSNPILSGKFYESIEIDVKQNQVKIGDALFTTSSEVPGEVGMSSVCVQSEEHTYLNSFCFGYRPYPNTFDSYFLAYMLRAYSFRKKITFLAQGISRFNISKTKTMDLPVALPINEEQTKIGELFKNLDTLINQHQTRVAQLANIKKSMLDKMFPKAAADVPEVRFRGFVERWKSCKFEDTVTFYSGLTYSPNDVQEKPGTLVLRSSNVKRGEIINADNVYVNSEVINCDFVQQGDIVVVVRNGSRSLIGKHAQVKSTIPNTVIGAFMTGIRSKQPSFINALLDTSLFYQEVEKCLGATINQITQGMFKKMHFMIPANENEMALIGNYFQNLDTLMAQNQKALDQLKNLKQALLNKMFV